MTGKCELPAEPSRALLSCPFCGSRAELAQKFESYGYHPRSVWIVCTGCRVSTPPVDCTVNMGGDKGAEGVVIGHWNTRKKDTIADPK